jgi:hypothetical protein
MEWHNKLFTRGEKTVSVAEWCEGPLEFLVKFHVRVKASNDC